MPVAVKALTSSDPETAAAFEPNIEALASLSHPHVVKHFTHIVGNGMVGKLLWLTVAAVCQLLLVPLPLDEPFSSQQCHCSSLRAFYAVQVFLVTEYVSGWDLGSALSRDRQRHRRTGWHQQGHLIALGIAQGLAYLHDNGVLWFSCKPSNVLLDRSGAMAKVADFGLASFLAAVHSAGQMVSMAWCCGVAQRRRRLGMLRWSLACLNHHATMTLIVWTAVSSSVGSLLQLVLILVASMVRAQII